MATAASPPGGEAEIPEWKLAKEGLDLFLNNRFSDSQLLFKQHPNSLQIKASYAFVVFMDALLSLPQDSPLVKQTASEGSQIKNARSPLQDSTKLEDIFAKKSIKAYMSKELYLCLEEQTFMPDVDQAYLYFAAFDALMSFEDDKMAVAMTTLKEVEQFVGSMPIPKEQQVGAWKFFRPRVVPLPLSPDLIKYLESQIILADNDIMVAILTFLHQDLSGYFKGGWVLRKAWKIYQKIYSEILGIYEQMVGKLDLSDLATEATTRAETPQENNAQNTMPPSKASIDEFMKEPAATENVENKDTFSSGSPDNQQSSKSSASTSAGLFKARVILNGYKSTFPQSKSSYSISGSNKTPTKSPACNSMKKSGSVNSALSNSSGNNRKSYSPFFSPISDQLSYFTSAIYSTLSGSSMNMTITEEDKETITRLMGAVAFGYGLFQLGVSLLPPSLLKITSFFGLGCNRQIGLANLMFARLGTDPRAPLATMALLWYHTIVRPFYAVDGNNTQAPVATANQLIAESEQQYGDAALFLFFKGRLERLKSDFQSALTAFQASVDRTEQREIQLLSLHEIGWCNLLELDFSEAHTTFCNLKSMSRFSRVFYGYLCIICAGASERLQDYQMINEIKIDQDRGLLKGSQLEQYLVRRINMFPSNEETLQTLDSRYWKLYLYELLYLWNSLPSCRKDCWNKIVAECDRGGGEPMVGLAKLLQGACYILLKNNDLAIESFKKCLKERETSPVAGYDAHVSAFAEFELASLLMKNSETKTDGKNMMRHVQSSYKDYDFENRLNVRIHSALK